VVALRDLFAKKRPVLLDLVYYTCPNLCDLILNGQTMAMREMTWEPGKEYEVVTISIDPSEHADIAAQKKATYLNAFGRPASGWHFLTDHDGNVKRLAEQMGYHYRYDARQQQFVHPGVIMMLTPEGHISRYLYGARFNARDMRFALEEASEGRTSLSIDKILLWCFHYDPSSNKYVLYASNAMKIGGVVTILLIGLFMWRLFRTDRATYGRGHREKMA
jgi:protein SCO1/2